MRHLVIDPDRMDARDLVRNLQYHPAGQKLAAVVGEPDYFRDVCRYDLALDRPLPGVDDFDDSELLPRSESAPDPVASRDLELVAFGVIAEDGLPSVVVVDTWAKEVPQLWLRSDSESVDFSTLAFSHDGAWLFTAMRRARPGQVLVTAWDVDTAFTEGESELAGSAQLRYSAPKEFAADNAVRAVAADPAGKRLAVGAKRGEVWMYDLALEKYLYAVRPGKGGAVLRLEFSPDGQRLLVHARDRVAVYAASTGELLGQWAGDFAAVAASPDGRSVALAEPGGVWALHEVGGGPAVRYNNGTRLVTGLAFAPDGLTCAAGGEAGQVVVWDV